MTFNAVFLATVKSENQYSLAWHLLSSSQSYFPHIALFVNSLEPHQRDGHGVRRLHCLTSLQPDWIWKRLHPQLHHDQDLLQHGLLQRSLIRPPAPRRCTRRRPGGHLDYWELLKFSAKRRKGMFWLLDAFSSFDSKSLSCFQMYRMTEGLAADQTLIQQQIRYSWPYT